VKLTQLLKTQLRPYRWLLLLIIGLQLVQTYASLRLPSLNAQIISDGALQGDTSVVWNRGQLMVGFAAVQLVFTVAAVYVGARVAIGFGRDVRDALFHQVTAFSAREVGLFGAPSLITRVTNDVQQVQQIVVMTATMMVSAPLTMVVGSYLAWREDPGLSVILLVAGPFVVTGLGLLVVKMVPAFQAMQVRIDRLNQVMRDQVTGLRVVRAFGREPYERQRFAKANDDVTEVGLEAGRYMAATFPLVMATINLASVSAVWIGAGRIEAGDMQVGSLVAYLTYLVLILMAVVMLTFTVSMLPRSAVAAERIMEVLETESSIADPAAPLSPSEQAEADASHRRGTVEFRDISFRYPGADHPVLCDIDLTIEAGTTCAVIGSTGAGKTALVDLVPRLFDASSGTVLVNGFDVRRLSSAWLAGRVAYVPQRAYLFGGTVASNLRVGRPDATDDDLWDALEVAQAADFVRAMPDGLEAEITQGGTNVSGGQRQRLCIARAITADPQLLIFDDSFSALDLATDARLRRALQERRNRHGQRATMLVVAQRVSTIEDADQIVVLEQGRIVGLGRHADLVEGCPTYAEIVDSQATAGVGS
jgi:ATP-binding cassette subfamily B protein